MEIVRPNIKINSIAVIETPLYVANDNPSINSTEKFNIFKSQDNSTPKKPDNSGTNDVIKTSIPV